ncbi:hypothetical protein GOP47_0009916 [Adiantum capillus-veneris]|uniref:Splicing factor YJU2 n=1 Tax=Adiantum capillus-veneris TaxID=13818 RepID=A0A9D4UX69_ADICA|nr:hypothetical protein GOP47_0009916 [Adiantum capillus-veneris]
MGERKVMNKYYPPDFDPLHISRPKRSKNSQSKVRMMLPMSLKCNTCGHYLGVGTKFNTRKEDAQGESYLGIQIFRFYFKCPHCASEISYKTDPQNSDYMVECGATRNHTRSCGNAKQATFQENIVMKHDYLQALEKKALASKVEMDQDATIDELICLKARHSCLTMHDNLLQALHEQEKANLKAKELAQEDKALVQQFRFEKSIRVRRSSDDHFEEVFNSKSHHSQLKRFLMPTLKIVPKQAKKPMTGLSLLRETYDDCND